MISRQKRKSRQIQEILSAIDNILKLLGSRPYSFRFCLRYSLGDIPVSF